MSNVRAMFMARSIAMCPFQLPYCSGAKVLVFSATCIIVIPTCLKAKLQSTGKRMIVCRPDKSVTPDFFMSIMSRQCFHLFKVKPSSKGKQVIERSKAAHWSSVAPAFMVEKSSAEG